MSGYYTDLRHEQEKKGRRSENKGKQGKKTARKRKEKGKENDEKKENIVPDPAPLQRGAELGAGMLWRRTPRCRSGTQPATRLISHHLQNEAILTFCTVVQHPSRSYCFNVSANV